MEYTAEYPIDRMVTRSMKAKELPVNINFDKASRCWMLNKKKIGEGCYKYITPRRSIRIKNNKYLNNINDSKN